MKPHKNGLKIRGLFATLLAIIFCGAIAFFGIFGGFTSKNNRMADATASGTQLDLGTGGISKSREAKQNLPKLLNAILTGSTTDKKSYSEFETAMNAVSTAKGTLLKTTADIKTNVKMGGFVWNVVGATRLDNGDIVATLWLAAATENFKWNDWAKNTPSYTYPSNMYSSSKIRSLLVGTPWVKTEGATTLAGTSVQGENWATFLNEYNVDNLIATPSQVGYQATENSCEVYGWSYIAPNEACGTPATSKPWYSGYNYSGKNGYNDWAGDPIWLPSLAETGYAGSGHGLWKTDATVRTSGNSQPSWLRSGSSGDSNAACYLYADGSAGYGNSTTYTYAVRPALHLNLKSAASAAGVELPTELEETPTYNNGTFVQALEKVDDEHLGVATGSVTQTHRTNTTEVKTLTASDYEIRDGGFYAKLAGSYSIEFQLVATDDLPIWDGTHYDEDGYPKNLVGGEYVDALFWELADEGGGDPTYTTANQTVTFTIKKATPTTSGVAYTGETQLYSGGKLPDLTHTGSVPGEARLNTDQTLSETVTSYNWTFYPTDDLNYNDSFTGTVTLSVKKPEIKEISASFDVTAYNNAVAADPSKAIYSSNTLAEVREKINEFVTIDSAVKEDGNDFEDFNIIKQGYTLEFAEGKTSLEGGANNNLRLSFGGVTCNLSGAVPVLTVDLAKIEVTTNPSTTSYTALDTFKTAGMVVTATYTDGKTKVVTGYTIIYNNGHSALWYGDTSVTLSYTEANEKGEAFTKTTTAGVTVTQITFFVSDVTLENASKPYTGSPQTIALGGTALPDGITAKYSYEKDGVRIDADQVVNAGEYSVIVNLQKDDSGNGINYRFSSEPKKTAQLTITKVDYEGVENISFTDGNAQYTAGSVAGALKVENLPTGVIVNYEYYSDAACNNKLEESAVVNMGEYYVKAVFTVDGNHNEIESKTAKLTVIAHALVGDEVTGVETSYVYKGEAWKPQPTVTVTLAGVDTVLTEGVDYDVEYSTEEYVAGTFVTVTVTGKGNFSSAVTKQFQITKAKVKFTWAYEGAGVYDGSVHSAVIKVDENSVCDNDKTAINTQTLAQMVADGVSSITYTTDDGNDKRTAAGTYTPGFYSYPATAPWNNYDFEFTNTGFTFTVAEAVLPTIEFNDKEVVYDGEKHFMEITVSDGELNTKEIEVKYYFDETSNIFVGRSEVNTLSPYNYRVRVEIKCTTGNYVIPDDIATMYANLQITPRAIAESDVSGVEATYTYNGNEITPDLTVAVVLKEGAEAKTLTVDSEYSLSFTGNRIDAGDDFVTVTVSGVGNYTGSVSKQFKINKARLGWEWEGEENEYVYNGNGQGVSAHLTGVADRDKATVVPTIYYVGRAGTDYPKSTDKPVNAGNYTVIIALEVAHDNYGTFSDRQTNFTIKKADPRVTVNYSEWNQTDKLYVGQLLPEIVAETGVDGNVSWKLVNGAPPVLLLNSNAYTWVFTPVGEDAKNYNVLEGTLTINAYAPTFKTMTVRWNTEDGNQPFLWSSATLEELKEYLWVEATLEDGTDFGRVTTLYSLKGSWGTADSPKLNGYDETRQWTITVGLGTLTENITNVTYNLVVLDRIEVTARDESAGIKKEYDALSKFDTESIIVTAHYKDGSQIDDIQGYTVTYEQKDERLWWGNNNVVINYKDNTVEAPVSFTVDGLQVRQLVFDTSHIAFDGSSVNVPYDGLPHSLTLNNADDFTIGTISYVYKIRNGNGWDVLDGVQEVTAAGEYRIEATFTIVDDELLGEGVYTRNYTLSESLKSVTFIIGSIKYEGADDIVVPSSVTTNYNGDVTNLYASAIMEACTGVSAEVWGIARFEYRILANGDVVSNDVAVNAGTYFVTIVFENDANHAPIPSKTLKLTVNKINPTLRPVLDGPALKETPIKSLNLVITEGDTPGYFSWVKYGEFDPDTYVLHTGSNAVYYTFTPEDTKNYNVLEHVQYLITAKDNYAVYMYADVVQGDTELFTSYSLDKLLELAADENEGLTIKVFLVFNDGTREEVGGYTVKLASGNTMLDEGDCYLVFTYTFEGEEFTYGDKYVRVHPVDLGRIEATFTQGTQIIYTSENVDTLNGLISSGAVNLVVESYFNNGDYRGELTADEYELSGDWSAMTADGTFAVTVSVKGANGVSTTFDIQVTLVILVDITAEFEQNGKKIHVSGGVSDLEKLISDGAVNLTVTAHYNDSGEKVIGFGADGYSVAITNGSFAEGENDITVSYTEGGIAKTCSFTVKVTAVLVVSLHAEITDVSAKIYTDTPVAEVEKLLRVIATYNDGTTAEVTDFAIEVDGGKFTAGTQVTVSVVYNGLDISDNFQPFALIIGVIKHETVITFSGETEYVYDGTVKVINEGASTNHSDDETITYQIDGVAATVLGAKTYTLVITAAETDDYYGAEITVEITVDKATYDMSGVTFGDKTEVYDGKIKYLNYDGSLPFGVLDGVYAYFDGEGNRLDGLGAVKAGEYKVTVSFGTRDAENYYAIPDMEATLTIEKAEVVIDESGLLNAVYTYNGEEQTVSGAAILKADENAEIVYANNTFTNVPAGGVLAVEITVAEGENYKAFRAVVEVTVNKAALTITANDHTITYGEAADNGGVTPEGFVNGEQIENLIGELVYGYNYSQYGNVGKYVITLSGVSSNNYDITLVSGVLTVDKATATVNWTVGSYTYDGKPHAPTAAFTDLFGTDIALTVTISGKNGGIISEAIGAGEYVATASTSNPNYAIEGVTQEFAIIAATDNWVKFDFRKDYTMTYGSVPETEEELAALAELLINQSYVRAYYNGNIADIDDVIRLMTVRLEVDGNTLVTAGTPVGRYNICFEFKPEYAEEYATYAIYQTLEDSENTNLGRLVIVGRELTLNWSESDFKFDGEQHLLTATVNGFVDGETPVSFTMNENGGEFKFEIDGTTVTFKLAVNGDFKSVGGHVVTVTVDDANYYIANPYATVSISEAGGLSTLSWALISAAGVMTLVAAVAITVAARRKVGAADEFDAGGFNELYYEDEE